MSRQTQTPDFAPEKPRKQKKQGGLAGRIVRRFFLVLFTLLVLVIADLCLAANLVFNGPSEAARDLLTMTLTEPSATKWIPGLFMDDETLNAIRTGSKNSSSSTDVVSDTSQIVINKDTAVSADEWAAYPNGVRVETYSGSSFNAYIMIIRDPSKVYLATSTEKFSTAISGTRIDDQIVTEGAIAGINAGAFFDDGTSNPAVGTIPEGLVVSRGEVKWTSGQPNGVSGFAGFTKDDILVVAKENLTKDQAAELNIRDGCCFGPPLIINGEVNDAAYNSASGLNPRTAVGQRSDGAVIFVCADGRQPGSMGATYKDITDIMIEYGAVNACNMDGGSSTIMVTRDAQTNEVQVINSYSLLQERPRKMPTFWMVAP